MLRLITIYMIQKINKTKGITTFLNYPALIPNGVP